VYSKWLFTRVAPDFGSSKSGIPPFFGNPAECSSGHISSCIWLMTVHLLYSQLITDKTNAADLSSGVFTILISVTWTKRYEVHCHFTNFIKTGNQRQTYAVIFIRHFVL